ncbi:MAG: hypothetical protein CL502_00925 [Actinobacteria bacterium]|nr:hypothetical protein [Actinomycetota bacterium]
MNIREMGYIKKIIHHASGCNFPFLHLGIDSSERRIRFFFQIKKWSIWLSYTKPNQSIFFNDVKSFQMRPRGNGDTISRRRYIDAFSRFTKSPTMIRTHKTTIF